MNKIIRGKKYDTETATKLAEWNNEFRRSDFNWFRETLYRKRTGEFFLYGEGGPMSKYAERAGSNGWGYGERIEPMTIEEAQEWAERYLTADEYENIFGAVEE